MQEYQEYILSPFQKRLLEILEKNGPTIRSKLVALTGRARTTIYDNLVRLSKMGLVKKVILPRESRGRPFVAFMITEEGRRLEDNIEKLKDNRAGDIVPGSRKRKNGGRYSWYRMKMDMNGGRV